MTTTVFFHYGKPVICRVPESLPSVFYRALGKDRVCRVSNKIHSANKNTRQNTALPSDFFFWHSAKMYFAECYFSAYGKMRLCRVPFFWHSTKMYFAECYFLAHGKMRLCRVPFFWHSAKIYFAECLCFGTRQRGILRVHFFCPRQISFLKQFLRP